MSIENNIIKINEQSIEHFILLSKITKVVYREDLQHVVIYTTDGGTTYIKCLDNSFYERIKLSIINKNL